MPLPKTGIHRDALFDQMRERKRQDADWRGARTFSLIYPAGEAVESVVEEANRLYLHENALNPFKFPSLRQMETEVVEMTASLLNGGPEAGGAMTSGGTESILMAVLTARERARAERGVEQPDLLIPRTAHPAFAKAAKYLGLRLVHYGLRDDLRADPDAARALLGDQTALLVGSAPCYPFGVVDPIPELAGLAAEHGVAFHTDACVGGFMLPFLERMGREVPPFDFRVPGVSTISADVHKYGYCTKGASVIAHRDAEHVKRHQLFVYDQWPGGLYGSFAMAGARPAAPIAAAWAIMSHLGEEGYVGLARRVMDATDRIRAGIDALDGLHVVGDPDMSLLAFGSDAHDVAAIGDVMDDRGWHLDRQQDPDALHMMISPEHDKVADRFLEDLAHAVAHHGASRGKQARYA